MAYFARFREHEGQLFRLDTRIYLRDETPANNDSCVAAIVGKNPGSARGEPDDQLASISLDGDKLLPYVRNRFRTAYTRGGLEIPHGAYVRVWNLFYLCNESLAAAVKAYGNIHKPLYCDSESSLPRIVWFAWGSPETWHRQLPLRFRGKQIAHPFYVDMDTKNIVRAIPGPNSRAKHTQGLIAHTVENHLATILCA